MQTMELSTFQKEKLKYYFKFLGPNENDALDNQSLRRLTERVQKFTGWASDSPRYLHCVKIHTTFYENLFEKSAAEGGKEGTVSLKDWYAIWCHILPDCKGMSDLPEWLRKIPEVLFDIIDRKEDNLIDTSELKDFFVEMLTLEGFEEDKSQWAQDAHDLMTDDGRYPLNRDSYERNFANFLIGRTTHGPGKYIFGCFKHENNSYQSIHRTSGDNAGAGDSEKRPRKFAVMFD